jgi:hypothetical protein
MLSLGVQNRHRVWPGRTRSSEHGKFAAEMARGVALVAGLRWAGLLAATTVSATSGGGVAEALCQASWCNVMQQAEDP